MSQDTIDIIDAVVRWLTALFVPVVVITMAVYLLRSKGAPDRIKSLLEPFSSLKLFGQEIVLHRSEEFTATAEASFRRFRVQTKTQYDALVEKFNIDNLHKALINDVVGPAIGGLDRADGFRSTIHVADSLFAESYYQLVPYFPGGGGDGRSWSIRFGIVGRTWRLGDSLAQGSLSMAKSSLIDQWGMTDEEATAATNAKARPSLMTVVLRDDMGKIVGVLFADSLTPGAFGRTAEDSSKLASSVEDHARTGGLNAALAKMVAELPPQPLIPMLGKRPAAAAARDQSTGKAPPAA